MNISDCLKQLREDKGITQKKISTDLNINRATYAHYETGRRQPDLDTVKLLAKYHNCSTDYLLGQTDVQDPYQIQTIAARHDEEEWTEEELESIEEFKEFVRMRRGQKKGDESK